MMGISQCPPLPKITASTEPRRFPPSRRCIVPMYSRFGIEHLSCANRGAIAPAQAGQGDSLVVKYFLFSEHRKRPSFFAGSSPLQTEALSKTVLCPISGLTLTSRSPSSHSRPNQLCDVCKRSCPSSRSWVRCWYAIANFPLRIMRADDPPFPVVGMLSLPRGDGDFELELRPQASACSLALSWFV